MYNIIFATVVVIIALIFLNWLTYYLDKNKLNKKFMFKDKSTGIKISFTLKDSGEDVYKKFNKIVRKKKLDKLNNLK